MESGFVGSLIGAGDLTKKGPNLQAACTPSAVPRNFVGNRDYGKNEGMHATSSNYKYIKSNSNEWKRWKSLNIVVAGAFSKQLTNLPPYVLPPGAGRAIYENTHNSRSIYEP